MSHILLVEDTLTQALYMQHTLEKAGHKVTLARSGAKALEALNQDLPDCVLTDINMPGMDGYELVKQIKESAATANLPCILLLTASTIEEARAIMDSRADAIAFKSGSEEKFLNQVKHALDALSKNARLEEFFVQSYRQVLDLTS